MYRLIIMEGYNTTTLLGFLLSVVFFTLGLIHFYWRFTGNTSSVKVVPTNEDGEKVITPGKRDTLVVAIGLSMFGLFYLVKAGLIFIDLPNWTLNMAGWLISIIFLLRAMGDFKYVGFFKKLKTTEFGRLDSLYYSPLCLVVGIIGLIIELT